MTFGERLKYIRKQKGLSQEQLALKIGLQTKAAVSKIEKNITDPNQTTICKLAEALGVSPRDFFSSSPVSLRKSYELEDEEFLIIKHYRNDPNFKAGIDSLVVAFGLKKDSTDTSSVRA